MDLQRTKQLVRNVNVDTFRLLSKYSVLCTMIPQLIQGNGFATKEYCEDGYALSPI